MWPAKTSCSSAYSRESTAPCGLGATYAVYLRLIRKLLVDFLLVVIELFYLLLRLRRYKQISIGIRVNFVYAGRRVKVTGDKKCQKCLFPHSHSPPVA